MVTGESDGSMS